MLRSLVLGLVCTAASCFGAAQAAIIDVSYVGYITDGSDLGAHFLSTGTDLAGYGIKVEYIFDTNFGAYNQGPTTSSYTSDATHSSPALSATITINNLAVTFDGSDYGAITATSTSTASSQGHEADASADTYVYSSVSTGPGVFSASVLTGYAYSVQPDDSTTGYFQLADGTSGSFTPTSIVSTVPLPASLPLFAAGLIGLCLARRLQQRAAIQASA